MSGSVTIGDAVEVRVVAISTDGHSEQWVPATITFLNPRNGRISVAFSDGERMALRRDQWRRPLSTW